MPLYKAEAIVLRRANLGEADRVVTLFTRERGKLTAAAKGARKPKSRFAGRLELFTHLRVLLAVGRTLDVISQVEVIDPFAWLRQDLMQMGHASLVTEALDRSTADREPSAELFGLMRTSLELIRDGQGELATIWFLSQLLHAIGYGPTLERCVVCGRALAGPALFSYGLGGALCGHDRARDPSAVELTPVVRKTLGFFFQATPALLPRLVMDERLRTDVRELLCEYLEYRLEVRLRSPHVIGKLREIPRSNG